MQKNNHIKALFFLGIFSLFFLHQVVPHWHHQDKVQHSHKAIAHSESHSHNQNVPEKESSNKGLLDLFLVSHAHSVASNDILVTNKIGVKHFNLKKDISSPASDYHYSISINYNEAEKVMDYHPPHIYFEQYLSSLNSRGPPSLG
jgi:hypothetical protein